MTEAAACAAALATLPGIGPAGLRRLLVGADPVTAWEAVVAGEVRRRGRNDRVGRSWQVAASATDPAGQWAAWSAAGIDVVWWGDPRYPARLLEDPEPPGVLFRIGDPGRLGGRCVGVVGTRRCSPDGRSVAYHLARDLAASGVCVVSGLALGVDGAAHQGALQVPGPAPGCAGGTVGVAASGVDVVYPPRHAGLWAAVAARGLVVSETPPGRPAQAWRFPSRNRIIAALADVVVVVESHAGGGSMLTAEAALERGVEVCVVPGPVSSPASAGTNQLLRDGATPVRDAADVLDALGGVGERPPSPRRRRPVPPPPTLPWPAAAGSSVPGSAGGTSSVPGPAGSGPAAPGPVEQAQGRLPLGSARDHPVGVDAAVLEAVGWRPTSMARVVARCGLPLGTVVASLERLRGQGAAREDAGWWSRTS